jgi:hypothetical protein
MARLGATMGLSSPGRGPVRDALRWSSLLLAGMLPAAGLSQTCNTAERSVGLILDASGSMNARLASGETRMTAAQRAVKEVASQVPPKAQLALRIYGAKSPTSEKNCRDSHVAVPFGDAGSVGPAIASAVEGVKALGFTPIAYALEQAAADFPAQAKQRVIVLVSDGKETCQGDPVIAARALAAKGIVVHTIGFVVDSATRMQLESVAAATGGRYFDAPAGNELPQTLKAALGACKQALKGEKRDKAGILRTAAAQWLSRHAVINAETGQQVGSLDTTQHQIELPAGIYEVKFGPSSWKSIEVRSGETTTIAPAVLKMARNVEADLVDTETGVVHGQLNSAMPSVTVMPGLYDLRFKVQGAIVWPHVKLDGGTTVTLDPVTIRVSGGLGYNDTAIIYREGKVVEKLNFAKSSVRLPPGEYVLDLNGEKHPLSGPKGGEMLELKRPARSRAK